MSFFLVLLVSLIFLSSLFVVLSTNPMYSLCSLISSFLFSAICLALINQEFFSMMYIIIYVGAIAVLFTFVVMMVNFKSDPFWNIPSFPTASLIAIIFIPPIFSQFFYSFFPIFSSDFYTSYTPFLLSVTANHGAQAIGNFVYTQGIPHLLLASFILLIAMIGSILLTLNKTPLNDHSLSSFHQVNRDAYQTLSKFRDL